jgi:nitric oxide reductase subunit B
LARAQPIFLGGGAMHIIEWLRLPGDLVFLLLGVVPLVIATSTAYLMQRKAR